MSDVQTEPSHPDTDDVAEKEGSYWFVVAAAFIVNFIVDGVIFSFGILLIELVDAFDGSRALTALVGSLMNSIMHLTGLVTGSVCDVYGSRWLVVLGACVAFTGLVFSVFAKTLLVLCVTFGVIGGLGMGLMYTPANACVMKHFNKKRAQASGIATCGTDWTLKNIVRHMFAWFPVPTSLVEAGLGTVIMNKSIGYLSQEYGWRGAVLITSGLVLNGVACGLALPKLNKSSPGTYKGSNIQRPQEPDGQIVTDNNDSKTLRRTLKELIDFSVLRDIRCIVFLLSAFLVNLAFPLPFSLLPDQVSGEGMDKNKASWLVSSIGITNIISRVFLGWLGDRVFVNRVTMLVTLMFLAGISLAISPLLTTFETKLIFTCSYGIFIGGYIMLLPVVLSDLFGSNIIGKTFGLNIFTAGLTILVGAPIGGWIFDQTGSYTVTFLIAGSEFFIGGVLILLPNLIKKCFKKSSDSYNL